MKLSFAFHQLLAALACKSFWHFHNSNQITTFTFCTFCIEAVMFLVLDSRCSALCDLMTLFTFVGTGVMSEAVQIAFPVVASVPSLLQTYQPSKHNQKRSRGNENHAIQLLAVDILKPNHFEYILVTCFSAGHLFKNCRRVPCYSIANY